MFARPVAVFSALSILAAGFAQQGSSPGHTLHFRSNLGSFKIINGSGKVDISFTGTLLIAKYEGTALAITGNLRKEFEQHGRVAYFGTGKVTLDGKWRSCQWFGKDMSSVWTGAGVIRMYGEFDKNLDTGDYYFDNPADKMPWGTGLTLEVPEKKYQGPVPQERKGGG